MSDNEALRDKSKILLKTLVAHYIAEGQPIASKTLADSASVSGRVRVVP